MLGSMSSYGTAVLKPAGLLESVVAEVLACLVLLTFTRLGVILPDQPAAASARRRPSARSRRRGRCHAGIRRGPSRSSRARCWRIPAVCRR